MEFLREEASFFSSAGHVGLVSAVHSTAAVVCSATTTTTTAPQLKGAGALLAFVIEVPCWSCLLLGIRLVMLGLVQYCAACIYGVISYELLGIGVYNKQSLASNRVGCVWYGAML